MDKYRTPVLLAVSQALFLALYGCGSCTTGTIVSSWPTWRGDQWRSGTQLFETTLNDAKTVSTLHVAWTFTTSGPLGFHSSPVVDNSGNVYVGDSNGYFYALAAGDGHILWEYPKAGQPGLTQQFDQCLVRCNPSGFGIASSGALTNIGGLDAVVFGAPDPSTGGHYGDGHLFALNQGTGDLIWESPVIAPQTGTTSGSMTEIHQQIGYSSPLVYNDRVYIGVADHMDDPIQQGRVIAVKLSDGSIDPGFNFIGAATRGGGVWGSLAAYGDVFVTTGNTNVGDPKEPSPNNGLSMLRLNKDSGAIIWKHQPVPYVLDHDPDWSAGPAVMYNADCGPTLVSTQKDGWTWAVKGGTATPGPPAVMWAFPPGPWTNGGFMPGDGTGFHNDIDYKRPGATWGDVFIGTMGGWETIPNVNSGLVQLHALNVCANDAQRVRWLKDIPGTNAMYGDIAVGGSTSPAVTYPLGPPTVTVDGMVFVGTNLGHIVAVSDPSLQPALGNRCEDPGLTNAQCQPHGRRLVPDPWIHDIALPGAPNDGIFGEPAIANGRIYVATVSGHVYKLQP